MKRFNGTIEFLRGQCAAIVELTATTGEWAGISRIDIKHDSHSDLYAIGYERLCAAATINDGILETYKIIEGI